MSTPLFDCHCDTAFAAYEACVPLRRNALHLDLERLRVFSPCAQVFAVCAGSREKASTVIKHFENELERNSDIVQLCLNFRDIDSALSQGKIAALLSIEGAEQINSLDEAYELGVRIVHLTWNYDNALSGAAMDSGGGLSRSGRNFVSAAQDKGIALDMSHISENAFWDVLDVCKKPVIAGHSNAKALRDVPRNLRDAQFSALVSIGGGVGINLYPEFLGLSRDVDAVTAHIEHFLSLGGEKSVFLGCDLDGIELCPKGISGVQDVGTIYEALLKRNYSESLVKDIFWNNLYGIMEKML